MFQNFTKKWWEKNIIFVNMQKIQFSTILFFIRKKKIKNNKKLKI